LSMRASASLGHYVKYVNSNPSTLAFGAWLSVPLCVTAYSQKSWYSIITTNVKLTLLSSQTQETWRQAVCYANFLVWPSLGRCNFWRGCRTLMIEHKYDIV